MSASANPSVEAVSAPSSRWIVRLLPSLTDFAFLFPILALFYAMTGTTTLLSDGDTGWHIRTGQWIWQHRAVPTTDLFSFTRPHDSWFAWEWLWDLLFFGIHQAGGLGAVAFVNICLICVASALLFRLVRRTTNRDVLSIACTVLAMATSCIHWLARPHLFSWLFVLAFAHALLSYQRGRQSALIPLPFLMILWTNLHGAFFLGILMLLLPVAGEVTDAFLHTETFWQTAYRRSRAYLACAGACALATFVNPYGFRLHAHIIQYLGDKQLLAQIGEYKSMDFHNPLGLLFEMMLMLALPVVLWACIRKQYTIAISLIFWAHLAIYSARNIPIFALLSAPSIAWMLKEVLSRPALQQRFRKRYTEVAQATSSLESIERMPRLHVFSAAVLLALAASFAAGLRCCEGKFHEVSFPASVLPVVRNAHFSRLFTTDTWASYFVYHLYPNQPSFLDGRSDFFGTAIMERYSFIINARWDWEDLLNEYGVDSVVLQPTMPVVAALKTSKNWKVLFDNGAVVVFKRTAALGQTALAAVSAPQVSLVRSNGRKELGPTQPGRIVNSHIQSQERRS